MFYRKFCAAIIFSATAAAGLAQPSHVAIDPSDGHTTVYVSVPKTLPAAQFSALQEAVRTRQGATLVAWSDFIADPGAFIGKYIRRNEYSEVDLAKGLPTLLERFEGVPIGVTWNGGLAITGNDYAYSARSFGAFAKDPNPTRRAQDRRADPVHPLNHLEPLLSR